MRFIPRSLHAVFDYTMGLFFLLSPWLLGLSSGAPSVIPIVIGVLTLLYSIFTHYEGGLIRVISFSVHLILDVCAGSVFVFAPFLLHFSKKTWARSSSWDSASSASHCSRIRMSGAPCRICGGELPSAERLLLSLRGA